MFSRPSSKRSSTLATRAAQPTSFSASSASQMIPNSTLLLEAFADHELVALLEDVERHELARQQDQPEREQRQPLDGRSHWAPG